MNTVAPVHSVLQLRSSAGLYGADRMVLALNQGLRQHGTRSRLLSLNNYRLQRQSLHEEAGAGGDDAVLLPCRGRLDMQTVAALVDQIDECQASTLHVHDYKSAFYAWLATRRRPGVKLVATLHGWVEASQSLRLYNRLEIALLRRFDQLVVVSGTQITRLSQAGVPLSRIARIDNGITLPQPPAPVPATLREELGVQGASRVFAAVGRFSAEKNLLLLVESFAAVARTDPDARLLLAGDGPDVECVRQRVAQLGMRDRVRLLGNRADMQAVYGLVDWLVLPSLSEGMPLVVLEAMSRGIPVIASAVGDVPRLLAHTQYGKLVPAGDGPALRAALAEAMAQPALPDRRAEYHVRAHHSSLAMARRYAALYETLGSDCVDRRIA